MKQRIKASVGYRGRVVPSREKVRAFRLRLSCAMKHRTDPQKARKNDPLTVTLSPQATRLARAWHSEFARDAADIASAAVIDYLGETMAAIRKKDWNTAEESAFWIEEAIARAQLAREKRGARP